MLNALLGYARYYIVFSDTFRVFCVFYEQRRLKAD